MTNPLDQVFAALADPTRRAILAMLLEDDMAVTDVAEPFAMSLAAISKHLQILAEAGLIAQEKRGRVKWCKLEPDALRAASVWMQGFGVFDPVDLDGGLDWMNRYLATNSWVTLGMNLALGIPSNQKANASESCYLPDNLIASICQVSATSCKRIESAVLQLLIQPRVNKMDLKRTIN